MFENYPLEVRRRRLLLGVCCTLVVFVGFHRDVSGLPPTSIGITGLGNPLFDSEPGHTLRVIQSVGILLPLFAGLLRFTTNDQSDVSVRVNDYLLLGILGLVLAGMVAALAGVGTNVAGILKISLFFVLLTFTAIGIATIDMLSETADSTEGTGHVGTDPRSDSVAEAGKDELKSEIILGEVDERGGDEEETETQPGPDSGVTGRNTTQAVERADDPEAASAKETNDRNNNNYDDRDDMSEDESESQGRPK